LSAIGAVLAARDRAVSRIPRVLIAGSNQSLDGTMRQNLGEMMQFGLRCHKAAII
jgi:hypothetical protein